MQQQTPFTRVVSSAGVPWTPDTLPVGPAINPKSVAQGFVPQQLPSNAIIIYPPTKDEMSAPLRMAVTYTGPVGAPALSASLYVYDTSTQAWFQVDQAQTLTPSTTANPGGSAPYTANVTTGTIGYFNLTVPYGNRNQGIQYVLLVTPPPGGSPSGNYLFALGTDLADSTELLGGLLSDISGLEQQILGLLAAGQGVQKISNAVTAKVSATTTATQILRANASRLGAVISNDSTSTGALYLIFGNGSVTGSIPSSSNYSVQPVVPGGSYTLDMSMFPYIGQIWGVFGTASGFCMATEFQP